MVEHLELLKKNNSDYLLIVLEPGKNADRSDIWYELRDPGSPKNLLESCLSLFTKLYDKDDLIDLLLMYCEELDQMEGVPPLENTIDLAPKSSKKRKKKTPPNDNPGTEGAAV